MILGTWVSYSMSCSLYFEIFQKWKKRKGKQISYKVSSQKGQAGKSHYSGLCCRKETRAGGRGLSLLKAQETRPHASRGTAVLASLCLQRASCPTTAHKASSSANSSFAPSYLCLKRKNTTRQVNFLRKQKECTASVTQQCCDNALFMKLRTQRSGS